LVGIPQNQRQPTRHEDAQPQKHPKHASLHSAYRFENDDFHSATAKTVEDAQKLVEAEFEYVCDFGEVKLFKRRKVCETSPQPYINRSRWECGGHTHFLTK
jgi:hypothetical protein